jgi:hypothetical protein
MRKLCYLCQKTSWSTISIDCGHTFHKDCIETITRCPICHYEFNVPKLLKCTDPKKMEALFTKTMDEEILLQKAKQNHNTVLINFLSMKIDKRKLAKKYIINQDVREFEKLVNSKCLNFHQTLEGKTILEDALEVGNQDIINMILDYCEPNCTLKQYPQINSFPKVPPRKPPPPRRKTLQDYGITVPSAPPIEPFYNPPSYESIYPDLSNLTLLMRDSTIPGRNMDNKSEL